MKPQRLGKQMRMKDEDEAEKRVDESVEATEMGKIENSKSSKSSDDNTWATRPGCRLRNICLSPLCTIT